MLSKILAIAWTQLYITFSDRGALIIMILIPIMLSTLIGLVFGSFENDISISPSQLLIVNQDEGSSTDAGEVNYGQQNFVNVLVDNVPAELAELIDASLAEDVDSARQQVEDGEADALLIIPPDFSAQLVADAPAPVELYYNPGNDIAASILISITEQLATLLNTGQAAQQVLLGAENAGYWVSLAQQEAPETLTDGTLNQMAGETLPRFYSGDSTRLVSLESVNVSGEAFQFDSLQYFAPSMAILFMTFAMAAGTRSILEDQQNWTLQRLMTTPTPRWVYMAGKLLGVFGSGMLQMLILVVTIPIVALALGRDAAVWGNNYLGLGLVMVAVVATATGLGLLLAAISKTPRQADNLANAVVLIMAVMGGTFVVVSGVPVLEQLSMISFNKWGIDAFVDLSANASTLEVLPAVGILLAMALLYFGLALWRFNRRLDI